ELPTRLLSMRKWTTTLQTIWTGGRTSTAMLRMISTRAILSKKSTLNTRLGRRKPPKRRRRGWRRGSSGKRASQTRCVAQS
ncbi:hypothetical protein FOZ63_023241, partial [Perkinsus olseni]